MKSTKMNTSDVFAAVMRFARVAGAGIIAVLIGILVPLNTYESLFAVAVLVALDKYLRAKNFYANSVA
jgi:hypothetical protein